MSKVIKIELKTWTGTVTIFDRLVLSQVEAVEAALNDNPPIIQRRVVKDKKVESIPSIKLTDLDKPKLPALIACVEKWELSNFPENVTVDNFPLTPRKEAHALIDTIFDEIRVIYNGEQEIPNE